MTDLALRPDVVELSKRLRSDSALSLDGDCPAVVAQAPGRLDVMGGIADYGGALALQAAVDRAVVVAGQPGSDQRVVIRWLQPTDGRPVAECAWPLSVLYGQGGCLVSPQQFAGYFDDPGCEWARSMAGVFYALLEDRRVPHFAGGVSLVVDCSVPLGAGLGEGPACQVAVVQVLCALYDCQLAAVEKAQICGRAAQVMAEPPGSLRDHLACLSAEPAGLLQIRCQPHELLGTLSLPRGVKVVAVDSGVRTDAGTRHVDTRVAAEMARHMIALGASRDQLAAVGGQYLANITPEQFVEQFRDLLPTRLSGRDFVAQYGQVGEWASHICLDRVYKVRSRSEHYIYENRRAEQFAACIARAGRTARPEPLIEAGQLMYASHWSYGQRCGLATVPTDRFVSLVRQRGPDAGLFGARITDAGTGGALAVLMRDDAEADQALHEVMHTYRRDTGIEPSLFHCGSSGAELTGWQRLT